MRPSVQVPDIEPAADVVDHHELLFGVDGSMPARMTVSNALFSVQRSDSHLIAQISGRNHLPICARKFVPGHRKLCGETVLAITKTHMVPSCSPKT